MDVTALVKRIETHGYAVAAFVSQQVFETDAWVFLRFAREDLLEGSDRGYVNALSNAKRAVENRVDTLLYAYGLRGHAKTEHWNYPTKADMLRLTGVFVPQALQHMITSSRNELEHDYRIPQSGKDVADKVDVAQLFLGNTDAEVNRGFFRWIVGPNGLRNNPDAPTWKVQSLPSGAYGLLLDRPKRSLRFLEQGRDEQVSLSQVDASDIAELFRLLKAALEPGSTQIVGPMTEATFAVSYL